MSISTEYNNDKSILYIDNYIIKRLDVNGQMISPINSEALSQAFKSWLVSGKGEKIRTRSGGWLVPYLAKPLNQDTADTIKKNIITGLSSDFSPPITVTEIDVVPDSTNNRWIIRVAGYNAEINTGINTYAVVHSNGR